MCNQCDTHSFHGSLTAGDQREQRCGKVGDNLRSEFPEERDGRLALGSCRNNRSIYHKMRRIIPAVRNATFESARELQEFWIVEYSASIPSSTAFAVGIAVEFGYSAASRLICN